MRKLNFCRSGLDGLAISLAMIATGCTNPADSGLDLGGDSAGHESADSGPSGGGDHTGDSVADAVDTDTNAGDVDGSADGSGNAITLPFRLYSVANNRLIEIQTDPPAIRAIGTADIGPMSISFSPDGTLYGVSMDISGNSKLFTLSPDTGNATLIAPLEFSDSDDFVSAAQSAFAPDGTLYLMEYGADQPLWRVDLDTGELTPSPISGVSDFTFDAAGRVVSRDDDHRLATCDALTGEVLSTVGGKGELKLGGVLYSYMRDMCFAPDGKLYAIGVDTYQETSLYRIDPDTGKPTFLMHFDIPLIGLAPRRP